MRAGQAPGSVGLKHGSGPSASQIPLLQGAEGRFPQADFPEDKTSSFLLRRRHRMAGVAAVVCDTVLPNFKRNLFFCGWMPAQGHLVQANRSQLCPRLSPVKPSEVC